MLKLWLDEAWEDYLWWQTQDKKTLRRINQLIRDIERGPFEGIGKPEPLRANLSGKWLRRIDQGNRIIFAVEGDTVFFYSLRDHYTR
jgi:toxin YoeB